jgi:hypothetical protein
MYDVSDPRSALSAPATSRAKPATEFAAAEYAKFYETAAQEHGSEGRTWYVRGQNFIIAYSETEPGARFSRVDQADEYVVLMPDRASGADIAAEGQARTVDGYTVNFVPPGDSTVTVPTAGRMVRLFTTRSADLAARCVNAASYARPHPNIPRFRHGRRRAAAVACVHTASTCHARTDASAGSSAARHSW